MSYIAVFLIVSLLIFIHELGHFVAARMSGIPISRFSVGMGRALWTYTRGGTEYRISALPLGGYVLPDIKDGGNAFLATPVSARIWFALGGPLANFACAALLFAVLAALSDGLSLMGLLIEPWQKTWLASAHVLEAIPKLFQQPSQASGILGVVAQGGDFVGDDVLMGIRFAIVMSINLAILNLLPVPPLDGGKVVLYSLETLHHGTKRLQLPLNLAGMLLLAGILGYTTIADLKRIIAGLLT